MFKAIDEKAALEKLGGSKVLYHMLLTGFCDKYATVDKEIESLTQKNDFIEARRISHSMKGVGGNLVSLELKQKAKDLEDELKNNAATYKEKLESFRQVLNSTVAEAMEIIIKLEEEGVKSHNEKPNQLDDTTNVIQKNNFLDITRRLIDAIKHNDFYKINNIYSEFKTLDIPDEHLINACNAKELIENYDYDGSIEYLNKIVGE